MTLDLDHERQVRGSSEPPTAIVSRDSFRALLPGTLVDEIYEVDARIGVGAMGEVYAATHVKLGKRVAIKVIGRRLSADSAAINRFVREARTLARLQHPAIVAVEHVGELADGRAYFVMELLRGETLFDRLLRGPIPLLDALRLLDQLARALDAAHAEGITHRDLKPENIFLVHLPGEPPAVKLVDFGLAKTRDVDAERTQSGFTIGTPLYMSPEQMRGGPAVDHRTDVYALGCVAYELLLGTSPFPHARTVPEIYAAHLHAEPPCPRSIWPQIPPPLDHVLFAMLAKDPGLRPTLEQVRAVVTPQHASAAARRAATEIVRPPVAPHARSRLAIGAIVVLIGGAVGAALAARHLATAASARPPISAAPPGARPPAAAAVVPQPDGPLVPSSFDTVPPAIAASSAPRHRAVPARPPLRPRPAITATPELAPSPPNPDQVVNPFTAHPKAP